MQQSARKRGSTQVKSDVLFVCRANLCRSPMMEYIFRSALTLHLGAKTSTAQKPWVIGSAGTHAREGLPPHPLTIAVLRGREIDVGDWASRILTPELVSGAALILTAGLDQRREVVNLVPQAVGRTFPLLPFAAWLSASPSSGPAEPAQLSPERFIEQALDGRARVQPMTEKNQELADPLSRRRRRFAACAQTIDSAIDAILGA